MESDSKSNSHHRNKLVPKPAARGKQITLRLLLRRRMDWALPKTAFLLTPQLEKEENEGTNVKHQWQPLQNMY